MSKDPWGDLTKISILPMKGPATPDPMAIGREISSTIKTSISWGRWIRSKRAKAELQKAGYDPITIDAVVAAIKAGQEIDRIIAAADQAAEARKRADELRRNPPPVHGSARWSNKADLVKANFLLDREAETGPGLYLGQAHGSPVYWQGESHLLTVAPTRTGKGTMQIIPNLLRYQGSAVVLDPKGELALATGKWRAENVGPTYILNPFELAAFGSFTHAFNPLDQVRNAHDATKLAEMIYPRIEDPRHKFFDNEAIGFLSGLIEFTACFVPPAERTMANIRDTVSTVDENFNNLLSVMQAPKFPLSIRNAAKNVQVKNAEVSKPRLIDSLSQHLRIWDTPGLRKASAKSDFDFKDLKDKPATVYLVLPFDDLTTYDTYVRMIFAAALDAMLRNPAKPDVPVLFVLDEFLGLEADDRFVSALRTHASAGVRLWFFLQDLPTLEQKYPTTWKSFLQAEVKTFFGTDDPHTARLISDYLGDTTIAYDVPTANPSVGGSNASYSISENIQLAGRALLKPDEVVRELAATDLSQPRKAFHFMRGVPPVMADIAPWFTDPLALTRFDAGDT